MPPKEKLPAAEIALLEEWVKRGAPDPRVTPTKRPSEADWWSLKPLVVPKVPEVAGVEHPVDRFLRARLAERKLTPSPEADRRMLIRRVSFDLLGLPPSSAEVEAFVNDADPKAYKSWSTGCWHHRVTESGMRGTGWTWFTTVSRTASAWIARA
jgi:hypothetical protein